jgi:Lon protease-like protein
VGERIAMGDLHTARLGHGLADSSHDGAEPRIASVGCRGRLIQSQSHQDSVISHDEILPCRTLRVRQFVSQRPRIMVARVHFRLTPQSCPG